MSLATHRQWEAQKDVESAISQNAEGIEERLDRIERVLQLIAKALFQGNHYQGNMAWPEADELRAFMNKKLEAL
jgi:hypothetical protein